jgi:predicted RNA binding protein YcfA (HicA-like mRNA interferase family)
MAGKPKLLEMLESEIEKSLRAKGFEMETPYSSHGIVSP